MKITAANGASPPAVQPFTLHIQAPPTVSLITPADRARYLRGKKLATGYSCREGADGSGLASCIGTTADGALLDTTATGPRSSQ